MPSLGARIVLVASLTEFYLSIRDVLLDKTESILELVVGFY
jgi:hypothetical protein